MSEINVLHLSDLHFGIESFSNDNEELTEKRNRILNNLIKKLKDLDQEWHPDIIAISGDIGFSGEEENYEVAWNWINCLLINLNLNIDRLILCPGNHDRYIKDYIKYLKRKPRKRQPQPIYPKIEDADKFLETLDIQGLAKRFSQFSGFCETHNIPPLIFNGKKSNLIGFREIQKLRFVVLNSSWFSLGGENDRGNIFIGLPHIVDMKNNEQLISPDVTEEITISILHHPFEWLNKSEIDKYGERSPPYVDLARNCDIILSGHTHGEEQFEPDKKHAGAWLFKTGAIFDKDPLVYNCEVLKINIRNRSTNRLKLYYDTEKDWIDKIDEKNPYLFSNGLSRLRLYSKKVLQAIYDKIGKECKIDRSRIINKIEEEISVNNIFFITGESMVGKSVIMKDLASKLDSSSEIFAFSVNDFLYNNIEEYFKNQNIMDSFKDILLAVKSVQNRFIFIDQSERILESENKLSIFKDLLNVVFSYNKEMIDKGILQDNCWKIILCCRSEKYKNVRDELDRLCSDLDIQIKNKKVKPLEEEELNQVCDFFPKLASLINKPNLNKLITLPKILDILTLENFKLTEEDIIEGYNHNFYTETYLMKQFWEQIIRNNEVVSDNGIRPEARDQLLQKISLYYFTFNKPYKITEEDDEVLFSDLISKRILLRDGEQLKFSHDVFEEWSLLKYMTMKSDIINDFLRPFNNYSRNSRAFQLFSRKLLEIDENYEKWKSTFNLIGQESDLNLKWKQDFIYGFLKSEILGELLLKLKSILLEENDNLLNYLLKILQTKCVIYEKDLKPSIIEWLFVISFLKTIFSELDDKNILEFSIILDKSLIYFYTIPNFINSIVTTSIGFIKTRILDNNQTLTLDYEDKKKVKANFVFSILWGLYYRKDEILQLLNEIKVLKKRIFIEVILKKSGWIILSKVIPEYTLNILKDILIKTKEVPEYLLGGFNRMELEHSFVETSLFNEDSFDYLLSNYEREGLELIHEIVNHATYLWCNIVEPVYFHEGFEMISHYRTPIPQKIQYGDNEIIIWGDHDVYRWNRPVYRSNLMNCALVTLEKWIIKQIRDKGRNPNEFTLEILKDTNSISIAAICISSLLCNYFLNENNDQQEIKKELIKSMIPFLSNPVFWDLELKRWAEVELPAGTQDYHKYTIDDLFPLLLFTYEDLENCSLIEQMQNFPRNIPFYFEEEKSSKNLIKDRVRQFMYIAARTEKENWRITKTASGILIPILSPPSEIADKEEDKKMEAFFSYVSLRSWIQTYLMKGEFLDYYDIDTVYEKIEEIIKDNKEKRKNISELIIGFYSGLIIHNWGYLIDKNKIKGCKKIILKAVNRPKIKEHPNSKASFGYKRSVARSLPILYKNIPKDRKLERAIFQLAIFPNHEVRDILFSNLDCIWQSNSRVIWKCIRKLKKLSLKKAVFNKPQKTWQLIKNNVQSISMEKLSPKEIALDYFRSVLNVIPLDETIKELESNENLIKFLRELFDLTLFNDINYKKTSVVQDNYFNNIKHNFYYEWVSPALKSIANATLYFNYDKINIYFLKPIVSNWKKMDRFLIIYLEELIILSNQPNTETRFIEIWYRISDMIFESIQKNIVVQKELIYLIFFQDHFGFILKKEFETDTSFEKLGIIIKKFLKETLFYIPIIQFLNEIRNPTLTNECIKIIFEKFKSFSYSEKQHYQLREEMFKFLNNHWKENQKDIQKNDEIFQAFKFLIDVLVEWGGILAGELQEELSKSNNSYNHK